MKQTKELLINYLKDKTIYLLDIAQNSNSTFIRDIIIKYTKKINKKITPHTFRRSRAIHLLDKGINIVYIQELLGHFSILTTQEYIKAITKSKFEAIEKVTPELDVDFTDWNDDQDLLNQLLFENINKTGY